MKKCYDKRLEYIVPEIKCKLCNEVIKSGEGLYMVVLTWGNGIHTCEKCCDEYEKDWSLHKREYEDDEEIY